MPESCSTRLFRCRRFGWRTGLLGRGLGGRSCGTSGSLQLNVGDLYRILRTAVLTVAGAAGARHAGYFLHQFHRVLVALPEDCVAAVGLAASAHTSVGIKTGIEERLRSFGNKEL